MFRNRRKDLSGIRSGEIAARALKIYYLGLCRALERREKSGTRSSLKSPSLLLQSGFVVKM